MDTVKRGRGRPVGSKNKPKVVKLEEVTVKQACVCCNDGCKCDEKNEGKQE